MPERTCTEPGCEGRHLARGYCRKHYRAHGFDASWNRKALRTAQCGWCGHEFSRVAASGQRMKACTDECARALMAYASGRVIACAIHISTCAWCGQAFNAASARVKYCSTQCVSSRTVASNASKSDQYKAAKRERYVPKPLAVLECGMCGISFKSKGHALYCQTCRTINIKTTRADCNRRRRARLVGADHERIESLSIYERDAWRCGVCGERVDAALTSPDPMSASLDHVIPLAHGGAHVGSNVQLAHMICNARKGDRLNSRPMAARGM